MRVAYIVSRFPSTTETFIAREMRSVETCGVDVDLYALIEARGVVVHPEAAGFVPRLRTASLLRLDTWRAQLHWLRHRPAAYLRAWAAAVRGSIGSPKFLIRTVLVVPMAARFAIDVEARAIDHVHAHWATHPALAANIVHRLTGVPYSFTAHAHDIFVDRSMLRAKVGDAAFVAVISDFNREYLARLYGDAIRPKLTLVRCGIDLGRYAAGPGGPGGDPLILCVGSLQPYKGHVVLIDALAVLAARGCRFRCLLVGEGTSRAEVERRIRDHGLGGDVQLLGARSSDEVLALWQRADVGVLASIVADDGQMEGIPVALMEALACRVPVVASRISGIPELVVDGRTGLLVEPGDAVALANALERLVRDPALRIELGRAGRDRVAAEFDVTENATRLVVSFGAARSAQRGSTRGREPGGSDAVDESAGAGTRAITH